MKRLILSLLVGSALALSARAGVFEDTTSGEDKDAGLLHFFESRAHADAEKPSSIDPKRIINESNSFLKEREPDMTAEEYAVYDKIATMLTTNPDLAVNMLEVMMNDKEPPSPAFDFILANAYYAANQIDRSEKYYRSAVKRYPTFTRAWINLGILYYTSNRFGEAVKCLAKAVSLGDRDPSTFGLLGFSLEKQGDVISAEMAYLQAVSSDPTNTDWKEGLLRIYVGEKQFGRAEPLVRSLIQAEPTNTHYWLDLAGILMSQHRRVDAMVVLEEAVSAGAAGPTERSLLGDLYAEQNLPAAAVAEYRAVLAADPTRGEQKLLQYARVLIAAGQTAEAERTLDEISDKLTPPGRIAWRRVRAELFIAKKDWPGARKEVEALLAQEPLDGRGLLMLGRTYLEEKNLPRAELAFESALKVQESTYPACLELANIEIKNRHYAKSVEYLERALSMQKNDVVEDALARVRQLVPHEKDSS